MWRNEILNKWMWYVFFFTLFPDLSFNLLIRRDDIVVNGVVRPKNPKEGKTKKKYFFLFLILGAVVIIVCGAVMKILHVKGASILLIMGLILELVFILYFTFAKRKID